MMRGLLTILFLILLALTLRLGMLLYAASTVAALWLVCRGLVRLWGRSVTAQRRTSQTVAEIGDAVTIQISITNTGRWAIPWLIAEDLLPPQALIFEPPNLQVNGRRMQLTKLAAGQSASMLYQLTGNRRGYYQVGPLLMETGDLFGLYRHFRVVAAPHFLMIYPRVIPLQGYDIASRRPLGEVRLTYRLFEDPTRVAGVRPYQPGDPLNRVHWRATARTGQLHSKEFEPSCLAGATVLLDFHRDQYPQRHEPVRSDLAVTTAASVAHALYQMGHQVGLLSNGRDAAHRLRDEGWQWEGTTRARLRNRVAMRVSDDHLQPLHVETRRGPETWHRIMETLARVELTDGLSLDAMVREYAWRMPRDATVVAIVSSVTPVVSMALHDLRRHGFAVAAVLNLYDSYDFSQASGALLAQGIRAYHLRDETSIGTICQETSCHAASNPLGSTTS